MSHDLRSLERPPEARAEAVEDLVRSALAGRVRVPRFQRGLKWGERDVLSLFDSIYRGLPIGSLLLWRKKADADVVRLGPVEVPAEAVSDAWWVVDGQQRLTALAAGLGRSLPLPEPAEDPYVVYFEPRERRFSTPPRSGSRHSTWIPLPLLLDAAELGEWIQEWVHRTNRDLVRAAYEAGKRIREYRVPLYIVETDDEEVLREIFFRTNKSGRPLAWNDVHDALYGHRGTEPSTTAQLADALMDLAMGRPDPGELTACLLAVRGLDVTRSLAEHHAKDPDALRGAAAEALPALRQALTFLRTRCAVLHLRLLPRVKILEVLVRIFHRHPEPTERSRDLLSRWVWRTFLGAPNVSEATLLRKGIAAVTDDEEATVQQILSLVPRTGAPFALPRDYDARSAASRLCLVALSSLGPRSLDDGAPIDVAALFESHGSGAVKSIVPLGPQTPDRAQGPANRAVHSGQGSLRRRLLAHIAASGPDTEILASHAVSKHAADALSAGDLERFFDERGEVIDAMLQQLGEQHAGWNHADRDRPSIDYLIRQAR